ncbi:MAG: hypothetical protein K2X27_21240 [Candidatus Obscuribacterales bacterium]|nr:hypothetical protein [Candidatus Obscuribacterales bacterium]
MRALLLPAFLLSLLSGLPAVAQYGRNDNPNLRNFYMARQQIQIMDDAPQVNDLRTNPQAAAQQQMAPAAPQALPRAGFSTYMSGYHGGNAGGALPQVNNGVPKSLPSAPERTGLKANAGKLKMKASPSVSQAKGPVLAKTYAPYAKTPSAPASGGSSGSLLNSSTSVQGSVLHWNKRRSGY